MHEYSLDRKENLETYNNPKTYIKYLSSKEIQ